jgi:histidinol-phosphate/aromatic aminotransferase/cobyric acid decarboxylase-like protein
MIVRSAIEPKRVFEELVQRDVLVRDVSSYPMLGNYFRVSIGTPEENDALLNSLRSVFEKLG